MTPQRSSPDRPATPSIHASAVAVAGQAILIRGPSGSGKSRLALDLLLAGRSGQIPATVLVGDDRIYLDAREARIWARPGPQLAGLIEVRGLGIRHCDFVSEAPVGLVVDLDATDGARLPAEESLVTTVLDRQLPRIPVQSGFSALPLVLAALITRPYASAQAPATTIV